MNSRLALLRQRRELLVLRAQAQRLELASIAQRWEKPVALADTLFLAVRDAQRYWSLYVLASTFYARIRRHRLGLWIAAGWTTWEVYRSVRSRSLSR